jgi:SAM-dependent methyltransferase
MLQEHLSQAHDAASRRFQLIDGQVAWIERNVLRDKKSRVLDLACGPGLYMQRLARSGHTVSGIDFSPASVQYARAEAKREGLEMDVVEGDLRQTPFGGPFDLVTLLFGELNVFRPVDARLIAAKAAESLAAGGKLLLEVSTADAVRAKATPPRWYAMSCDIWSDRPHVVLQDAAWDEATYTSTVRYYVIDAETNVVECSAVTYQAYSDASLRELLRANGFAGVFAGKGWKSGDAGLLAVVAERA